VVYKVKNNKYFVTCKYTSTKRCKNDIEERSSVAESILQPEEILKIRYLYIKLVNKEVAVADTERHPSLEK
jgi:hypothetical protein